MKTRMMVMRKEVMRRRQWRIRRRMTRMRRMLNGMSRMRTMKMMKRRIVRRVIGEAEEGKV